MKITLSKLLGIGIMSTLYFTSHALSENRPIDNFTNLMKETADKAGLACGPEIDKFCSTVNPGEGRVILCMMAHGDQISKKCGSALLDAAVLMGEASNFFQYAANVCKTDIMSTCSNAEVGDGNVAACLVANKEKISVPCQDAITAFQQRFK